MVQTKKMNESYFAKLLKEFNVAGELVRSRQDEKQGLLDEFDAESKRFFFGKISERALSASVKKTNKELARLDAEIRANIAKGKNVGNKALTLTSVQAPVGYRATLSGIAGGGLKKKKKVKKRKVVKKKVKKKAVKRKVKKVKAKRTKVKKKTITIITTEEGLSRKLEAIMPSLEKCKKRGVRVRIAAPINSNNLKVAKEFKKVAEVRNLEKMKARFVVIDSNQLMFMLLDDEKFHPNYDIGVWINTEFFALALEQLFDLAWKDMKTVR